MLELLEDTRIGYRVSSGRDEVGEDRDDGEGPGSEGEEGRPGPS